MSLWANAVSASGVDFGAAVDTYLIDVVQSALAGSDAFLLPFVSSE
jgi:hypothetical protein